MGAPPPNAVERLLSVAEALMLATETDQVLDSVASVAIELFQVEACSLSLYDASSRELVFFISEGSAKVEPFRMSVDQGIAGHVFRTGELFLSNDVPSERRFFANIDSKTGHSTRSMVCCAMGRQGRRIGTMQVLNTARPGGFVADDAKLLGILASMAGATLDRTRTSRALKDSHALLQQETEDRYSLVEGASPAMAGQLATLRKAASSRATVLLLGESGVGKEVAARAVHRWSERAERPFVAINCSALSATLLESELFGHEKGAFTGAVSRKRGKFEVADGGTLFLDEIGEMAPDLQAKLLRVLQDGELQRVGGNETIKPNVRVLAATNKDLSKAVESNQFRQDLFYRLNVISVTLPPLRERADDIEPLVQHFLSRCAQEQNRTITGVHPDAMARLRAYDWPGNVRELANVIERAVVLCVSTEIGLEDLPSEVHDSARREESESWRPPVANGVAPAGPLAETVTAFKRHVISTTLDQYEGNQARAAEHLGLHPSNLSRALRQLGLR